MISTFWPASTRPTSTTACSAVPAETGPRPPARRSGSSGLSASLSSRATVYSANVPVADAVDLVPDGERGHRRTRSRRRCRRRRARAPVASARASRRRGGAGTACPPSGATCPGRARRRAPGRAPRGRRPTVCRWSPGAGRPPAVGVLHDRAHRAGQCWARQIPVSSGGLVSSDGGCLASNRRANPVCADWVCCRGHGVPVCSDPPAAARERVAVQKGDCARADSVVTLVIGRWRATRTHRPSPTRSSRAGISWAGLQWPARRW